MTTNESSAPTSITVTNTTIYYTIGHCIKKFPLPTVSTQTVSPTIVAGDISTSGGYKGSEVGAAARFTNPIGLTTDINGNIYVTDSGNNVVRKIDGTGAVTVFVGGNKATSTAAQVGTAGSDDTGTAAGTTPGGGAMFSGPKDITIDTNGNIFVADTGNNIIRRIV